jgi:uncharacterized membrane protein YecN with MAPEG domain
LKGKVTNGNVGQAPGNRFHLPLIIALTTAVFVLDLLLTGGTVEWLPYFVALVLTVRLPQPHAPLLFGVLCTGLVALGTLTCAPNEMHHSFINRTTGLAVLWGVAILLFRHKKAEETLSARILQ